MPAHCRCLPFFLFSLWLALGASCQVQAQDAPAQNADPQEAVPPDDSQVEDFETLLGQIRDNDREINRLYSSLPVGFAEERKKYLKQIDDLTEENLQLNLQISAAAEASFRRDPVGNPQAMRLLSRRISGFLDPRADDRFDPRAALRLATLLIDSDLPADSWAAGVSYPNVIYQAFRASFATNQFELAESHLDRIESLGIELEPMVREQLAYTEKKWNQELEFRAREAEADDLPRVKFETSEGDILIELFENEAPNTVANFVRLVELNLYDDLDFFVVKPGQYVRAGCPQNDGTSDPGYRIDNELDRNPLRYHFAGSVSMFHREDGSAGSQFLITQQPNREFDNRYTVFGRVLEGLDVVLKLKRVDMTATTSGSPSKILRATVIRKRDHEYRPDQL